MEIEPGLSYSSSLYRVVSVFQVFGRYDYSDDIFHSFQGSRLDAIVDNLRVSSDPGFATLATEVQ